jgi:hypothetical protein
LCATRHLCISSADLCATRHLCISLGEIRSAIGAHDVGLSVESEVLQRPKCSHPRPSSSHGPAESGHGCPRGRENKSFARCYRAAASTSMPIVFYKGDFRDPFPINGPTRSRRGPWRRALTVYPPPNTCDGYAPPDSLPRTLAEVRLVVLPYLFICRAVRGATAEARQRPLDSGGVRSSANFTLTPQINWHNTWNLRIHWGTAWRNVTFAGGTSLWAHIAAQIW